MRLGFVIGVLLLGCATMPDERPALLSSAATLTYSEEAATRLERSAARLQQGLALSSELTTALPTLAEGVEASQRAFTATIMSHADEDGRRVQTDRLLRDQLSVSGFIEESGADLAWRLNARVGTALTQAQVKQKVDTAGTLRFGLKEGVDKLLERRFKRYSEAQRLIQAQQTSLGKRNTERLETQTMRLTEVSWFLFVRAPDLIADLRRQLKEADTCRETLEDELSQQQQRSTQSASRAASRAAKKRIKALEDRLTALETQTAAVDAQLDGWQRSLNDAQNSYKDALKRLLEALES